MNDASARMIIVYVSISAFIYFSTHLQLLPLVANIYIIFLIFTTNCFLKGSVMYGKLQATTELYYLLMTLCGHQHYM